jgi:hypothetical protein
VPFLAHFSKQADNLKPSANFTISILTAVNNLNDCALLCTKVSDRYIPNGPQLQGGKKMITYLTKIY